MKYHSCPKCGSRLSFEALACWQCETELGYILKNDSMMAMRDLPAAARCANREVLSCNWIADAAGGNALCPGCRYTRTIPPQHEEENRTAWKKLEQAKRTLLYSLKCLGLSPPDRTQQPATGLAFDFLAQLPNQPTVFTAHAAGVITINITEADDAKREQRRALFNEPYRTVLGHLRHEVGHFYWDQLIARSEFLESYRVCFGDERQDYDAALQRYYQANDIGDSWRNQFVSRYASSHPWEDWAETWAYYLHIRDALDTAAAWKVSTHNEDTQPSAQQSTMDTNGAFYQQVISIWPQLCEYLNVVLRNRSVNGEYPFQLSETVLSKLGFVHQVVNQSALIEQSSIGRPAASTAYTSQRDSLLA